MISPIENHRRREKGVLVYPVYSRRSGGLSVGLNLFPDQKFCPFDCPYCEVFPFSTNAEFSIGQMEDDLRSAITAAMEQSVPIRDICFSGNGEPSLSPFFPEALQRAARIRGELAPSAELVLITNGTGLLQPRLFSLLRDAAALSQEDASSQGDDFFALNIWLKLDAGTPDWYQKINRSSLSFEKLVTRIKEFTACAPVTIQTMLCAIDGEAPPEEEAGAWEALVLELAAIAAGGIRKVQIYGKARPAPEDPKATALPDSYLEERADSLRLKLTAKLPAKEFIPVIEVFP
jgi:histidinol dehydrogenase